MRRLPILLVIILLLTAFITGLPYAQSKPEGQAITKQEFDQLLTRAQGGDPVAQALVGSLYLRGEGCMADDVSGFLWLTKASQQGYEEASQMVSVLMKYTSPITAMRLASIYMEGTIVPQNYQLAARWVTRAAELGFADGQQVLGMLYLTGTGVDNDPVQAHVWCNLAASSLPKSQRQQAVACREEAEKEMTHKQVLWAQHLAATWRAKTVGN